MSERRDIVFPFGVKEESEDLRHLLFLLVGMGGFVLSAFALGYIERDLDFDERWTIERIAHPIGRVIREIQFDGVHPPLYYCSRAGPL